MYDEIRKEEEIVMLRNIAKLSENGKIKWECVEYNPISFMDKDKVDNTPACLCHIFTLTSTISSLPYELEVAEYISVPSGKGDYAITLTRDLPDDYMKIDEALSYHSDLYDDCPPDQLKERFQDHPIIKLCDAVVPQIIDSDAVQEVFEWARFVNENGISKKLLEHPLTILGDKLLSERRVLDYHRCVLDVSFRESILK